MTVEKDKLEKKGVLEQKLRSLEERIAIERPGDDAKFKVIYILFSKLNKYLGIKRLNDQNLRINRN